MIKNSISVLGSGWLGFPLAQSLSKEFSIKLSTTTYKKFDKIKDENITPFIVDINNLSGEIDKFLSSDILIINIPSKNIDGFKELIKHILNSSIQKIVFISSISVLKDETSPLLEIENLFKKTNLEITILRFAGLIGYGRNPAKFFPNGKVVKDVNAPVNMIHRDDCINIIGNVIKQGIFDETFNCVTPSHPTKKEFYTYCAKVSDLPIPTFDSLKNESNKKIVKSDLLVLKLNYKFIHEDLMKIVF
ncbi:hypothetical protein [Candidatus Marinarcus aquaticus]|uniref:dTDP-glucose 4,6-dehydratase n=1 Tax=Candidatus Marinarcus aquaticus TaxID=2044504 RepID=A0A4Q0XPM3_9BACT|nr:hypothetical protein [Candidatus Marinarcus aquaticus]RXJ54165.1 hypothetical protein CRV04_12350 [Candidatus Marinarcus aquaticus]